MKNKDDPDLLSKVIETVRKAADGDYSCSIESAGKDNDLGILAEEINNLLKKIDVRENKSSRVATLLELTQFAIDHASIGCHWISSENKITYVNNHVCKSLGYTRDELLAMGIQDIDPDFNMEVWRTFWKELKKEKVRVFETRHKRKDGSIFPVEITTSYLEHDGEEYSCAFALDITARKKADEQIRRLAYYDSLTNLPNRRFFKELLVRALKYAERYNKILSVMFIDLDGFKKINDTLGHDMGDRLLKDVAERLEQCIRSSDYLAKQESDKSINTVSRIGGDEFIVILSDVADARDASKISQRILDKIAEPYQLGVQEAHISASIGISHYPVDGDDAEILLNNADMAMYQAKQAGRNMIKVVGEKSKPGTQS